MNYGLLKSLDDSTADCLVLGLFPESDNNQLGKVSDQDLQKLLPSLQKKLHENGDYVWQTEANGRSLLLVHCGAADNFNLASLRKKLDEIVGLLLRHRVNRATLALPQIAGKTPAWQLQSMLLHADALSFQFDDFKTINKKKQHLSQIDFYLEKATTNDLDKGQAIAAGIELTRKLADMPANHCTPSYLAEQAETLAKKFNLIQTTVFDRKDLRDFGMGAFLAVSQGSHEEPRFIEINYQGGEKEEAPIVLVGKGITFDSGGLSIKPANAMDEMKYDMAGAASVLGTLKACAMLNLPLNVVGLIACAENMPSGQAVKPGDIVKSMSGQTIEILNTDAEGRLVLADALTYAERFSPKYVIDIATLTGAMVVALGNITTGFMSNDEQLAKDIIQAGTEAGDKCWRLPLDEEYQEALESPLADMINASFDRSAGSITAACFLSRFTKKYRWAHLDIAGTAWISGKKRKATGRPVPLLVELLNNAFTTR